MTELPVNQKEYLKKYLGIGKAPGEKKKKKKKPTVNRIQIIDDDADVTFSNNVTEEDILLANEDAPQIVAIIDERPPSLRVDEKTKNPLWQPIGAVDENNQTHQKQMIKGFKIQAKSNDKPLTSRDISPPRRKRRVENENTSPPRKSKSGTLPGNIVIKEERRSASPGDNSPPRKNRSGENDLSPPRKSRESTDKGKSYLKKDDDISPPRRNKNVGRNASPPRRSRGTDKGRSQSRGDDISPPRRNRNGEDLTPPRRSREVTNKSKGRSRWDEGNSSPQKQNRETRDEGRSRSKHDDSSPPRKNRRTERELSPTQNKRETADRSTSQAKYDQSLPRKNKKAEDSPRKRDRSLPGKSRKEETSTSLNEEKISKKVEKTLEGRTSKHGLVNAAELIQETKNFQNQQENIFNSLPAEASGQNSETVYRDRQTGKIRNLKDEEEFQRKKQEEEEKNKEKYDRWGRGLAQVENQTQKLQDQLHEMSKPLARYADDEDLEKYLKEQEREGDPMLAYIRKKKRKKAAQAGEVTKPQFEGEFMPNRYGIRPGHRWDGVDRSNGYEKKWFEVQNEKKALQEDSYKWSTEDM